MLEDVGSRLGGSLGVGDQIRRESFVPSPQLSRHSGASPYHSRVRVDKLFQRFPCGRGGYHLGECFRLDG
jgi:hypothetical protein